MNSEPFSPPNGGCFAGGGEGFELIKGCEALKPDACDLGPGGLPLSKILINGGLDDSFGGAGFFPGLLRG